MILSVLIPAAGASRRMQGVDKLLEPVAGEPILRRQARLALEWTGAVRVTLPVGGHAAGRRSALQGLDVDLVPVPDSSLGMSESLRCGQDMPGAGLMILLPDMPGIGAAELTTLRDAFARQPDRVLRGASGGRPGHPVILPARLFSKLAGLSGDQGAKEIIAVETPLLVELSSDAAILDLDSPADWAAWRARRTVDGKP